ncbi:hypothetical protein jhhlp_005635 [Lomentospora prolificans]|uniref:Ima1 N-terminal domain-containing protein n=1 Tax=Lomentospora prolificans TaxID=41688 RepID=A0A2N3N3N3_9PEZI|nr:hypothetical protein jhhlp_005635 [Lomentospora prolificans]
MAPFRRSHNLRCFYCNRPTGIRFEGQGEVLCPHCDATNYLDEDGDITDPPVATTTASQSQAYAFQRSPTPQSPEPAQNIFCAKCLKNQHLYTASLAQYFPDDPDHPDYPALERKYYKFRQDLEERYPQMCADCEPKVLSKLNAAGYIAKTDFLRTAMERSRANRTSPRRRTMMFLTDSLGGWLWYGAFVLQFLWHVSAVAEALMSDLRLEARETWLLRAWIFISKFLPSTESLVRLSLQMTLVGIWWNPKFPEVVRGFSRPIIGLPKWYAFQAMLATARYLFPKISSLEVERAEQANAQLAIHAFVAVFILYVCILARKSVKLDTTPLFAPAEMPTARQPRITRSKARRESSTQNLSDVLDDILNTPSRARTTGLDSTSSTAELPPSPHLSPFRARAPPKPVQASYSEEMDWERTEEPAPALRGFGTTKPQPFGAPAVQTDQPQRAFWAKVPPAPKPPAQRLINPAPPATQTIKQDREIFTARFSGNSMLADNKNKPDGNHVDFAPPSFFSHENTNTDPRNSLADMLNSSFSLSQEEHLANSQSPLRTARKANANPFSTSASAAVPGPGGTRTPRGSRSMDAAFLVVLIGLWVYAAQNPSEQSIQIMRASLGMSALLTLLLSRDALFHLGSAGDASIGNVLELVLCVAEIGAVGHLSLKLWTSSVLCGRCFEEGLWIIVVMIGHRLWNALA